MTIVEKIKTVLSEMWFISVCLIMIVALLLAIFLTISNISLLPADVVIPYATACGTIVALFSFVTEWKRKTKENLFKTANKVSAWIDPLDLALAQEGGDVVICNSSDVPIYDVVVSIDLYGCKESLGKGNKRCTYVTIVPPGRYKVAVFFSGRATHAQFAASISFRDEKGVNWTRYSDGELLSHGRNKDGFTVREIVRPVSSAKLESYSDKK